MAFKAKDGKNFGNRQQQKAYDDREPKKAAPAKEASAKESKAPSEPAEPQPEEGGGDSSNMPIEEMVAQHGPAEKIEMVHDDATGEYSVTSHHGGQTHHSKHGSRDEAHMHAAKAAGVEAPEQQQPAIGMGGEVGAIPGM